MAERLSEARIEEIWEQAVRAGSGYPTRITSGVADLIAELSVLRGERDEAESSLAALQRAITLESVRRQ